MQQDRPVQTVCCPVYPVAEDMQQKKADDIKRREDCKGEGTGYCPFDRIVDQQEEDGGDCGGECGIGNQRGYPGLDVSAVEDLLLNREECKRQDNEDRKLLQFQLCFTKDQMKSNDTEREDSCSDQAEQQTFSKIIPMQPDGSGSLTRNQHKQQTGDQLDEIEDIICSIQDRDTPIAEHQQTEAIAGEKFEYEQSDRLDAVGAGIA